MKIPTHKFAMAAAVALAMPLAAVAPAAHATYVHSWSYNVLTGFDDNYTNEAGTQTGITPDNPNSSFHPSQNDTPPTRLSWGPGNGDDSSVEVEGSSSGTVNTGGSYVHSSTFTHNNFTIGTEYETLSTATILSQLTLTPTTAGATSKTLPIATYDIQFQETLNSGNCGGYSDNPCQDIYALLNPANLEKTFTYDDGDGADTYNLVLDIAGLQTPLDADACAAVSLPAGCIGLLTEEGNTNNFEVRFKIMRAVPAPGTLSILALGLACLILAGVGRSRYNV